jgi:hypothetical protein
MDRVGRLSVLSLVFPVTALAVSVASVQAGSTQNNAPAPAPVVVRQAPAMQAPRQGGVPPANNFQGGRANAPAPNAVPTFSPAFHSPTVQMGGQTTPNSGVGASPQQSGRFNFEPSSAAVSASSPAQAPNSPAGRMVFAPASPGPTGPMAPVSQQPTRITIAPAPIQSSPALNSSSSPTRITLTPVQPRQNEIVTPAPNVSVAGPTTPAVLTPQQPTRITIAPANNGVPSGSSIPGGSGNRSGGYANGPSGLVSGGYSSGAGYTAGGYTNGPSGLTSSGYNSGVGSTASGYTNGASGLKSGGYSSGFGNTDGGKTTNSGTGPRGGSQPSTSSSGIFDLALAAFRGLPAATKTVAGDFTKGLVGTVESPASPPSALGTPKVGEFGGTPKGNFNPTLGQLGTATENIGLGVAKGAVSTVTDLASMSQGILENTGGRLANAASGKGFTPTTDNNYLNPQSPMGQKLNAALTPTTPGQKFGETAEKIGEAFIPAGGEARLATKGVAAVTDATRVVETGSTVVKAATVDIIKAADTTKAVVATHATEAPGIGSKLNPAKEAAANTISTASNWARGTFSNTADSMAYHFGKHGDGRTIEQYTKDAMQFWEKNKAQAEWGNWNPKWETSYRLKVGDQGGYFTKDGKILTYWDGP